MVQVGLIRTVVGIIGNIISLLLFLSPLPTFVSIHKKRDVEQFSAVPYLATFMNCMLWCLYGLPFVTPDSTLVLTINGTGVVIELCYIMVFIVYSNSKQRVKVFILFIAEIACVILFGGLILRFVHDIHRRSKIIGIFCIIFCLGMYAAPLSVMKMVIKTKSVEFMPLYLSVAAFCNGTCWTIYSLLKFDINILIPNGIGLLFAIVQLLLYAIYYKSTQRILQARKNGDVSMTSMNGA